MSKINFKSEKGILLTSIFLCLIVQGILNYDFWNFGEQVLYFGWMPGAYLYRLVLTLIISPISLFVFVKLCWPKDENEGSEKK